MVKKLAKSKWLIMLILAVILVVFDMLVFNVSIINRGIVLGVGLDMEGDYVTVTVRLVLPKNGGVSSGGNNYTLYSAKGVTVDDAINCISKDMGFQLSLAHTSTIVVGREVLVKNKIEWVEYFLTDDKVNDTTLVVMADGDAYDIMDSSVTVGEVPSSQLYKMLKPVKTPLGLPYVSIKQFFVNWYSYGGGNYLPIVHKVKVPPTTDQEKDNVKEADALVVNRTAIIDRNGIAGELNKEQTNGISFIYYKIKNGIIKIEGRDGKETNVQIIDSKAELKYDLENRKVTIKMDLKTIRSQGYKMPDGKLTYDLDDVEKDNLFREITNDIDAAFKAAAELGVDIYNFKEGFYQKYGNKVKDGEEDLLKSLQLELKFSLLQR